MKFTSTLKRLALAVAAPAAFLTLGMTAQATGSATIDLAGNAYPSMGAVELNVVAPMEQAGSVCDIYHETMGHVGSLMLMPGDNYLWAPLAPGSYFAVSEDGSNDFDPAY